MRYFFGYNLNLSNIMCNQKETDATDLENLYKNNYSMIGCLTERAYSFLTNSLYITLYVFSVSLYLLLKTLMFSLGVLLGIQGGAGTAVAMGTAYVKDLIKDFLKLGWLRKLPGSLLNVLCDVCLLHYE